MTRSHLSNVAIAVVTKNRTNPAYIGARAGVDRLFARLGASARHYVPQTPDDIDEQAALIEEAVAGEPAAMLLAPCHRTRLAPALERVRAAGLPLFEIVSETQESFAKMFVGSDNEALGRAMAERMAEHLGGSGAVAIVDGHPNAETAGPRARGFRAALADTPSVRIVSECIGNYQKADAYEAFAAELAAGARPDGVIVANDYMALGVIEALDEAGLSDVKVVGANVTPAGVELIRSGRMIASAAFDALSMGAVAAEGAMRVLSGRSVPRRVELPAALVDATNVDAWDVPYEERAFTTWAEAVGA